MIVVFFQNFAYIMPLPSLCRISAEKTAYNLTGLPLYVKSCFSLTFSRSSLPFSYSLQSLSHDDSLWPHGLQHSRLPCPPTPRAYSNSSLSSWWCHPTITSPSPSAFNLPQHQGLLQWVSSSHLMAIVLELKLQHQSLNEYSGLISFRIE